MREIAVTTPRSKPLFMLGQQLRRLAATDPDTVRALVCRTEAPDRNPRADREPGDPDRRWERVARAELSRATVGTTGGRFAVVCDAGLGKTYTMRWLAGRFDRPYVPVLVRFDRVDQLKLFMDEVDRPEEEPLLRHLATEVLHAGPRGVSRAVVMRELVQKRARGQLVVLLDGADHALTDPDFPSALGRFLRSEVWRGCPVWVSGRPYAHDRMWGEAFGPTVGAWTFFRVERFDEGLVREYMRLTAGRDFYDLIPTSARGLLAVPRLLKLVCDISRAAQVDPLRDRPPCSRGSTPRRTCTTGRDDIPATGDRRDRSGQGVVRGGIHPAAEAVRDEVSEPVIRAVPAGAVYLSVEGSRPSREPRPRTTNSRR